MDKPPTRWGATPADWQRLDALGIGSDLLPVVSNPHATISPTSSLKALGKTPSLYDRQRRVVGIARWTEHQASDADLRRWAAEPDYGTSVITRLLRVLDVDVENKAVVEAIVAAVEKSAGFALPRRFRRDSAKCALAFKLVGTFPKRVMRVEGGAIEFLGDGQQFIAYGTHPKGARYEWSPDDPALHMVELSPEMFERVWSTLEQQFAVEPSIVLKAPTDSRKGEHLDVEDPVADWLEAEGLVTTETRRGALVITCPWADEHSSDTDGSTSTVWFRAGTNGHPTGHFKCAHAHCEHRHRQDFLMAVGYPDDRLSDFEDLGPDPDRPVPGGGDAEAETVDAATPDPFEVIPAHIFAAQPAGEYIIDDVIPEADIGVIYGPSTGGKSFVTIDMGMAIARGIPWRGKKVKQGKVVYIVAEGGGGFRKRLKAYAMHNDIDLADVPFGVIHAAPNLLDAGQVKRICASIERNGARVIVVDTFAQSMPGANENAGEDVSKAISHIRGVGRKVGAMVILVHHTGKDATKGARGWSGLRAAADFELEIVREGENRMINTTKQKDGDDSERWGFKLLEVAIGMRDDGKVITSCVITESDVPVASGVKGGGAAEKVKFGPWEQAVFDTYAELAVGGDVLKSEIVLRVADKMDKPESLKIRRATALRALKKLCDRGPKKRFAMVEDFVIEETN
jgi:hypothetical protein